MTLEQLLQHKIDELEPYEPIDDQDLEEIDVNWLAPIEGVSLDRWAAISAGVVIGAKLEILLGDAKIDHVQWRRACEGWTARQARDATLVIAASLEAAMRRVTRRLARGSIPPHRMT
jgi:hypothetical protein